MLLSIAPPGAGTAARWTARRYARSGGRRRSSTQRFVADPRRRRSPAGHQRALQPRRLADDRVPHGRRRRSRRRHLRRRGIGWPTCCAGWPRRSPTRTDRPARAARGPAARCRSLRRRRRRSAQLIERRRRDLRRGARRVRRRAEVSARRAGPARAAAVSRRGGRDAHRDIAITSLDAMGWGPLYDEADGGFFRCARRADWEQPHGEKLLDVNAALIDLYVDAAEILGSQRYAERADDVLRYVQTWLADPGRRRLGRIAARRSRTTTRRGCQSQRRSARARRRSTARCSPTGTRDGVRRAARRARVLNDDAVGVRDHARSSASLLHVLQAGRGRRALLRRRTRRCADCSTISSRWPRACSTRSRRPATSSTR